MKKLFLFITYLIIILLCAIKAEGENTIYQNLYPRGRQEISLSNKIITKEIVLPYENYFKNKTYMSVSKITDKTSPQWELLTSLDCITIKDGKLRVNNEDFNGFIYDNSKQYIGVAMGSFFGEIGDKFIITLYDEERQQEKEIKVFKVERKADKDTCQYNIVAGSNDIIEFVIDETRDFMKENIAENGYIFSGNFNNYEPFRGEIIKIEKVVE